MKVRLVTEPAIEPIMVEEAKAQLRVDANDEDAYLDICIVTARQWAEDYTNRKFITQTWLLSIDCFPHEIEVPFGRLQTVNSITYYDENNTLQTLSTDYYEVDTQDVIGRIRPAQGYSWPATFSRYNAVAVNFDCGYGDTRNAVPQVIRHGVAYVAAQLFEHRDSMKDIPEAAKAALFPYTLFNIGD